jgi:hypothetical protein
MENTPTSAPQPEHQHTHNGSMPPVAPDQPVMHQPEHTGQQSQPVSSAMDYPSDPTKTFREAVLLFWHNGKSALAGIVTIQVLLAILTGVLGVIALLAIVAAIFFSVIKGNSEYAQALYSAFTTQLPANSAQMIDSLSNSVGILIGIGIVAGAIAIASGVLMQALSIALAGVTILDRQVAHFGQVMKLAFKRVGPLFVQGLLFLGVVLVAFLVPLFAMPGLLQPADAASAAASGLGLIAFYLVLLVVVVYAAIRLAFAPQAVVSLAMGPIQSIKYSWQLTRKRFVEVLGALGIASAVGTLLDIVFIYIHSATRSTLGVDLLVSLAEIAVILIVATVSFAVIAQRLSQFRSTVGQPHKVNYFFNIAVFVVAMVISSTANSIQKSMEPTPIPTDFNQYYNSQTTTPDSSSLQDELNQYYQDSQNMQDSTDPYADPNYDPYSDPNYDPYADPAPDVKVN